MFILLNGLVPASKVCRKNEQRARALAQFVSELYGIAAVKAEIEAQCVSNAGIIR